MRLRKCVAAILSLGFVGCFIALNIQVMSHDHEIHQPHKAVRTQVPVAVPVVTQTEDYYFTVYRNGLANTTNGNKHYLSCPDMKYPNKLPETDQKWILIPPNVYIFSAFIYDVGSKRHVRIIGAALFGAKRELFCHATYGNASRIVAKVSMMWIPEHHNTKYSAAYYTCLVKPNEIPSAVSIVTTRCEQPTAYLPIIHHESTEFQFTVCVSPLNFNYGRAYELVSMIETNRVFGADRFVFYNLSINSNVDDVLRSYIDEGVVQVVNWTLPMVVDRWPPNPTKKPEIYYFGQLAAINDCLYRYKRRSNFVVFLDMDETIVPRKVNSWQEIVHKHNNVPAFIFACTFFRMEWPDSYRGSALVTAQKYMVNSVLKQKREKLILPYGHRSKLIVRPLLVETMGIHNAWRLSNNVQLNTQVRVNWTVALMHHYRSWNRCTDLRDGVIDPTIDRFVQPILSHVEKMWNKLPNVSFNIPLPFTSGTVTCY